MKTIIGQRVLERSGPDTLSGYRRGGPHDRERPLRRDGEDTRVGEQRREGDQQASELLVLGHAHYTLRRLVRGRGGRGRQERQAAAARAKATARLARRQDSHEPRAARVRPDDPGDHRRQPHRVEDLLLARRQGRLPLLLHVQVRRPHARLRQQHRLRAPPHQPLPLAQAQSAPSARQHEPEAASQELGEVQR